MSIPEMQTVQLNADGPPDSEMPYILQAAIRRAREGGVTRLFDGDKCIAELVPPLRVASRDTLDTLALHFAHAFPYLIGETGDWLNRIRDALEFALGGNIEPLPNAEVSITKIPPELREYGEMSDRPTLNSALAELINEHSRESASNTPDYLLANFLEACLKAYEETTQQRDRWYGVHLEPGNSHFRRPNPNPEIDIATGAGEVE